MGLFDKIFNKKEENKDFPPKPKWKPDLPIDLEMILEKAKYYTGQRLQIAIFQFGTIAIFPQRVENIKDEALITLERIYNSHPDFKPLTMDDGNFLIEYSQPAFTIVFNDEIEKHWEYIDNNHLDGVCRDEVLINNKGEKNVFDRVGKICLFGRSKMFLDAQNPNVILTFNPDDKKY